jgi:hypothetical protein
MRSEIVGNAGKVIDLKKLKEYFDEALKVDEANGGPQKKVGRPENWFAQAGEMSKEVETPWYDYINRLDASNYEFGGALWYMIDTPEHYPQEIEDKLCDYLNVDPTWTVGHVVPPGGSVPLHIDNNDYPPEVAERLERYIFQFGTVAQGQVLTLGDDSFHMCTEGAIIQWGDPMCWHGAANYGFETAYYLSIEGTRRNV